MLICCPVRASITSGHAAFTHPFSCTKLFATYSLFNAICMFSSGKRQHCSPMSTTAMFYQQSYIQELFLLNMCWIYRNNFFASQVYIFKMGIYASQSVPWRALAFLIKGKTKVYVTQLVCCWTTFFSMFLFACIKRYIHIYQICKFVYAYFLVDMLWQYVCMPLCLLVDICIPDTDNQYPKSIYIRKA